MPGGGVCYRGAIPIAEEMAKVYHVLYSKTCKKEIQSKIALHYPEAEREMIWEKVQRHL